MLDKREFEQNNFFWRLSTAIAVVSGFFSVIVFVLLVVNYMQIEAADPVNNELIIKMRQEYAALPQKDEALAARIRDLDLLNRKAFFTSQYHLRTGAVLLLIGISVFMIAFKNAIRWKRELPKLDEKPTAEVEFLAFAQSRQLITWVGVGMLGIGLAATLFTESALVNDSRAIVSASVENPLEGDTEKATEAPLVEVPTWEAIEKNWPSFRGPGSGGKAFFTTAPTEWDVETGAGVKWKVEVPISGPNSPVVWDNRIFMSGANEEKREIYCFNADDGKLLWSKALEKLTGTPDALPKVTEDTGYAAPSMVAHGKQVFAIFANGDLASYDVDGNFVWGYNVGVPENHYGHSSSLLAYDKFLYVQLDQSKDPKLMALDISTGKELWRASRQTISWASPIIAQTTFGPQLILNSETTVDAYDPITGAPLWSQECLSGEVAPSPAYANGMVFAANEYAIAAGIQLDKSDAGVTPKIAWEFDELLPEISSPVGDGERFYFGTAAGIFVCLDAKTGAKLWEHESENAFNASPIVVGDRIYALDTEGHMFIFQASSTLNLIATRTIGEKTVATPAFMDGRIYFRTEKHLMCIEQAHV